MRASSDSKNSNDSGNKGGQSDTGETARTGRTGETGVIGGSGFYRFDPAPDRHPVETLQIETPYGESPVTLLKEQVEGASLWFLPRHGARHSIPPHKINYRANIWALREAGVKSIIAVNAVGGISPALKPGMLVLPDQLIDYSWGREHTFFDGLNTLNDHIDFTRPYTAALRQTLLQVAQQQGIALHDGACLACTSGPRLETAAEIRKFSRDGCGIVGMTGMPEAALAREAGLAYACLALVVNPAAGLGEKEITVDDMQAVLFSGLDRVRQLIGAAIPVMQSDGVG